MAAERCRIEDRQFECSICIDTYKQPRYLPTCGHTFCEKCLFTYARKTQQETQGSNFGCPVCRKSHGLPENTEVTLQWIQTLPLNTAIIKMIEAAEFNEETKEERRICYPCEAEGEINIGVKFCFECKEMLCKDCTKYHRKFTMTKSHNLTDIGNMPAKGINVDTLNAVSKCMTHVEQQLDVYCKTHARFICLYCMSADHKACDVVPSSSPDIDMTTLREESEKLNSQINAMLEHIDLLQKLRVENKNDLKQKLKEIRENAEQTRDRFVQLMETVVKHVSDVTKQMEYETEHTIDEAMSRVAKIKQLAEQKRTLLDTIGELGSDRHKYVSSQQIKEQCIEIETQITEEDERLILIDAELELAEDIWKILEYTDAERLIELKKNEHKSTHGHFGVMVNPVRHLDAEVNSTRDSKLVKIDEHTVCPNDDCEPMFTGISVLHDGRIVLYDFCEQSPNCGYLCLYNPANKTMLKLKMNSPFNGTCIDDTNFAVSCPRDKTICIVSARGELRVEKTLKTETVPACIVALSNGQLAASWNEPPAFSLVDICETDISHTLYLEQDKRGRKFKYFDYMALDERRKHVIQPCQEDKAVYCFDFTGEPVFSYSHPELINPRGVALDKCCNIYVCDDSSSGSIHKLSPAGEAISIVVEGIPSYPASICSDTMGTGFWITQYPTPTDLREKIVRFQLEL